MGKNGSSHGARHEAIPSSRHCRRSVDRWCTTMAIEVFCRGEARVGSCETRWKGMRSDRIIYIIVPSHPTLSYHYRSWTPRRTSCARNCAPSRFRVYSSSFEVSAAAMVRKEKLSFCELRCESTWTCLDVPQSLACSSSQTFPFSSLFSSSLVTVMITWRVDRLSLQKEGNDGNTCTSSLHWAAIQKRKQTSWRYIRRDCNSNPLAVFVAMHVCLCMVGFNLGVWCSFRAYVRQRVGQRIHRVSMYDMWNISVVVHMRWLFQGKSSLLLFTTLHSCAIQTHKKIHVYGAVFLWILSGWWPWRAWLLHLSFWFWWLLWLW